MRDTRDYHRRIADLRAQRLELIETMRNDDGMSFAAIGFTLGIPAEAAHKLYTDAIVGDQLDNPATVHDLTAERTKRRHGVGR